MDCELLSFWQDASSNKPLLPDSQCSKLISQNQSGTSFPENNADTPDVAQGARRNNNFQAGEVITKIEDIFESLLDCIINEKKCLVLHIKSRARSGRHTIDAATGAIKNAGNVETKEITFPGKNQKEAWKFTALLRILELSHEALVTGIVTTKRDIYYRDPDLFVKQAVVDRYIDDLAFTLNIPRDALNIVATAKGLLSGSLLIHKHDGQTIDCSSENEGILVPNTKDISHLSFPLCNWILVIEKEATFRTLSTSHHARTSRAGPGLLITAKGYPDIATRALLHLLPSTRGCPPIYVLADYDPHGLSILSTYAHGSASLAHQNDGLAVPGVRWLGVKLESAVGTQNQGDGDGGGVPGILALTKRDRRLGRSMLAKHLAMGEEVNPEWRREVQRMLFLNVKAEIQVLGGGERLGRWVEREIGGWDGGGV
ncbi:hypothetical protein V495_03483 [Pseudogymnoascus sp. VKM F-4514 (FW-929)]|nr:hypothetical protein V495_03483 [Pseudogymnoascus sp. VKM F-4514 (FW-929)]KFY51888.1 hypothetical protein V497_08776 [Pseudogymnoascus sp. VKM F-4516 (FW-969)]